MSGVFDAWPFVFEHVHSFNQIDAYTFKLVRRFAPQAGERLH